MLASPRSEPVRKAEKIRLVDGVQHLDRGTLDDLVFQRRYSERSLPPRRPSVYTPYAPAWLGTPRVSAFRRDLGGSSPVPRRSAATSPRPRPVRLPSSD